MGVKKINIFEYDALQKFLKDYVLSRKTEDPKYSLSYYSNLIGASDSYLKQVTSGRRSLNLDKANLLAKKFRLNNLETSYFLTLVLLADAKTEMLKSYYESVILSYRSLISISYSPKGNFAHLFSDILTWEIYSLVGVKEFSPKPEWILGKLKNKNATREAVAKRVKGLVGDGVIYERDGTYCSKDIVIKHEDDIDQIYITSLRRAIDHLEHDTKDGTSYFDSFCFIVSDSEYKSIKYILEETKNRIGTIIAGVKDSHKTRICFMNTNLFYVSN